MSLKNHTGCLKVSIGIKIIAKGSIIKKQKIKQSATHKLINILLNIVFRNLRNLAFIVYPFKYSQCKNTLGSGCPRLPCCISCRNFCLEYTLSYLYCKRKIQPVWVLVSALYGCLVQILDRAGHKQVVGLSY